MKFDALLQVVGNEPVFVSNLLLVGKVDPADLRRQLSRWTAAGKLQQVRRGLYALAPPHRRVSPHPFLVANRLEQASYVSCESALSWRGHIPEHAPVTVSATTGRPARRDTALGRFEMRHVKHGMFWGFEQVDLGQGLAHVALAEKALLDLIHLTDGGDRPEYLAALRLEGLDRLDFPRLEAFARRTRSPKLQRAARRVRELAS